MVTFADIQKNKEIETYLKKCDEVLGVLGYTEHSLVHCSKVANDAADILFNIGSDERTIEIAKIAGYMHDLGNLVNRSEHAQLGGVIAFGILKEMRMDPGEIATIVGAIGNHDETAGGAVSFVSAALILADKCDVRRSRVRNKEFNIYDIHDRVNFAATEADIVIDKAKMTISLSLLVDTEMCSLMDYFEIFLNRMIMCRRAADFLGYKFRLVMNGTKMA